MANTYSNLFHHIVFSTKGRADLITTDIEERVWAYIGGIARKHGLTALQVGGIENHIHTLTMSKPVHSPSQIAQWLKGESSKWIHGEFPYLRQFGWQASIIKNKRLRMSMFRCCGYMKLITMTGIYSIDSIVATRRNRIYSSSVG